jgi:Tfp pilus assembly protein PilE
MYSSWGIKKRRCAWCTYLQSKLNHLEEHYTNKSISTSRLAARKKKEEKNPSRNQLVYVCISGMKTASQPKILPAIRKDWSDNSNKNILTTLFSTSSTTSASTTACHARGLITAHSCKLSTTLGGSTSTRPGVRKITLKTYDFVDISNATIPTMLGGSTTTSPPIMIVILW